MKRICGGVLLFAIAAVCNGCASRQVHLTVGVCNRSTHTPVADAMVTVEYIPPLFRSRPAHATGRTGTDGQVVLRIPEKDYPLDVRIYAPGHEEHKIATHLDRVASNPQWHSPQTVAAKLGTLDIYLRISFPSEEGR